MGVSVVQKNWMESDKINIKMLFRDELECITTQLIYNKKIKFPLKENLRRKIVYIF